MLGLGLSNGLLVLNLLRRGYSGEICILERSAVPDMSKRWCSWGAVPDTLQDIVSASWYSWSVQKDQERLIRNSEAGYHQILAKDFWRHFFDVVCQHSNIKIHFKTDCTGWHHKPDRVVARTSRGEYTGHLIIDSRPLKMRNSSYQQQFVGYHIETTKPSFDPKVVHLMHFEKMQRREIAFTYVLPYGERSALVESTLFRTGAFNRHDIESKLRKALKEQFGLNENNSNVIGIEEGCLPMSIPPQRPTCTRRYWPIGIRSGALRHSSGYGLNAFDRQSAHYANTILQKKSKPIVVLREQLIRILDLCFARVLEKDPKLGRECLFRAVGRMNQPEFCRLMRGDFHLRTAWQAIHAMPKKSFLKTLIFAG